MPMSEVWFIRHGESAANAGFASSDPALIPLTEKGWQQAVKVSEIIPTDPDLIVYSSYLRAEQTAQPTIKRFPHVECQQWNIQEFTYLSRALCEYWKRNDPFYVHGDGAESFAQFHRRVQDTYQRLAAMDGNLILIFGHGQFMRLMLVSFVLRSFEPTPGLMEKFALFSKLYEIPNSGIFKVRFHDREAFVSGLTLNHLQN
jgi:broad specificity phosphatase PhoE